MPPTVWAPPPPQLIRGARMLIVGYQADPEALADVLPPGLSPHPNNLVQMNMYEVSAEQTSGFGAFSLTYLTVEVEGHDSLAAEGTMPIPGRFFAYYWNSSPRVLAYAREAAGIPAMHGIRRGQIVGGTLTSTLQVDGRDVITARASVTDKPAGTLGGHLNYYTHRQIPRPEGGQAAISELIELPLPFVLDIYEATVDDIAFEFPEGHPAARLAPVTPLSVPSVLWADVTFTYSMGRVIRDYLHAN
ncbi:MAG TPA: acetoacetate decarboxylase family protein [Kribbella sp.]